jgi:phospholipase/carboxylesterase
MPLEYEVHIPADAQPGAPLIVLLHGRGSDRFDLRGLAPGLPRGSVIVTPEAPFPAAPWGYGPGSAWYRYLGDDRPEPESFDRSQDLLREFLDVIAARLPFDTGPLVLGGFSQGGTMSLGQALRYPGKVPQVLNFSGFLPNHPGVPVTPDAVRGWRIFWGHGTADPAIPITMAQQGRAALAAVGADLTARDYAIGHSIVAEELADASEWLRAGFAAEADAVPDGPRPDGAA